VRAKPAAVSTEKTVELMKLTKKQIEVTMFAAGAKNIEALKEGMLGVPLASPQGAPPGRGLG